MILMFAVTFQINGDDNINILDSQKEAEILHQKTGKTMIVVAARDNCDWCEKFKTEALIPLKAEYGDKYIICFSHDIKLIRGVYPTFWITQGNVTNKYIGYRSYTWLLETLNEK